MNNEISGGRNALHFAADYGQTDVIQCLIESGADVNVRPLSLPVNQTDPQHEKTRLKLYFGIFVSCFECVFHIGITELVGCFLITSNLIITCMMQGNVRV